MILNFVKLLAKDKNPTILKLSYLELLMLDYVEIDL